MKQRNIVSNDEKRNTISNDDYYLTMGRGNGKSLGALCHEEEDDDYVDDDASEVGWDEDAD